MRFAGVGQKYTQLGFRYYRGKNISVILFLTKIYIFIAISWKTEVHDPQNRRSWQLCGIINKMAKFKVNTFCEFAFSIYISSPKLSLIWKYRRQYIHIIKNRCMISTHNAQVGVYEKWKCPILDGITLGSRTKINNTYIMNNIPT